MMSNLVTNPRMEKNNLESEIQRIQQDYPAVIPSPLPSTVKDVSEQTESDGFLNDFSFGTLTDDDYRDLEKEQAKNLCLQVKFIVFDLLIFSNNEEGISNAYTVKT